MATGYTRVVYGDHGPYIELEGGHLNFSALPINIKKSYMAWYDELYTSDKKVKVYKQKRTVATLPNPPKGKYSYNNSRVEGYADYKVGKYYISPDEIHLIETLKGSGYNY